MDPRIHLDEETVISFGPAFQRRHEKADQLLIRMIHDRSPRDVHHRKMERKPLDQHHGRCLEPLFILHAYDRMIPVLFHLGPVRRLQQVAQRALSDKRIMSFRRYILIECIHFDLSFNLYHLIICFSF